MNDYIQLIGFRLYYLGQCFSQKHRFRVICWDNYGRCDLAGHKDCTLSYFWCLRMSWECSFWAQCNVMPCVLASRSCSIWLQRNRVQLYIIWKYVLVYRIDGRFFPWCNPWIYVLCPHSYNTLWSMKKNLVYQLQC